MEGKIPPSGPVVDSKRLPLMSAGALISRADKGSRKGFARKFRLRTPGIWYVWLRARCPGREPALVRYWLDDDRRLRWPCTAIVVPPGPHFAWYSFTVDPEFRAQVHAAGPGVHILTIMAGEGDVEIDKAALTLYYSATPSRDGLRLDHAGDPGDGKSFFPLNIPVRDGFNPRAALPPVHARRRFHVDFKGGDDGNNGLSPGRPWKTLKRVNRMVFRPGDAILLRRGSVWAEGCSPRGNGTERMPITLGTYGSGPGPVIDGGADHALHLCDQSWWRIQGLTLMSDRRLDKCGLKAEVTRSGRRPAGLLVSGVIATGNGSAGINIGGSRVEGRGYDGVVLENCLSCWNSKDGIVLQGSRRDGSRNMVIRRCTAYGNRGMAGMWIHSTTNGLIERCVAYNNTVVNIWTWNANNVTIRECESYRCCHYRGAADADGYDIDWGSQACTIDRCYSHHNEVMGYLIMGAGYRKYLGYPSDNHYNLLRWSVAEDEKQGISMAASYEDGLVYGNTILGSGDGSDAIRVWGWGSGGWPARNRVSGNIFLAKKGANAMSVDINAAYAGNRFDRNCYQVYLGRGKLIRWAVQSKFGGTPAKGKTGIYQDLESFRNETGQEMRGMGADPRLRKPGRGGLGRVGMDAYRPGKGSPLARQEGPSPMTEEWLSSRRKILVETGADKWGIPMEPGIDRDFSGERAGLHMIPGAFAGKPGRNIEGIKHLKKGGKR